MGGRAGEERFRLTGKCSFLSAAPAVDFLGGWSAESATVYDWQAVKETAWSSDGASWLARGPGLFAMTADQLDRFYLSRSIKRDLGFGLEAARLVKLACSSQSEEEVAALEAHLARAQDPARRKRIPQAIAYVGGQTTAGRTGGWPWNPAPLTVPWEPWSPTWTSLPPTASRSGA